MRITPTTELGGGREQDPATGPLDHPPGRSDGDEAPHAPSEALPAAGRFPRWSDPVWAVLLMMIYAAGFRVYYYALNRSLWLDEAYLALNINGRSFRGLLQPLDHNQAAPLGFLLLEKLAVTVFGRGEYALRLVPLLAGVVALPLFHRAARRLIGPRAALVGLSLMAVSWPLIYFSSEVKQYALDVAAGLAILAVASRRPIRPAYLAAVGSLAIWLSHPAIFLLGGVALALLVGRVGRPSRPAWCLICGLWALSFLLNYLAFTAAIQRNADLNRFWARAFPPWPPTSRADLESWRQLGARALTDPLGVSSPALGVAMIALGVIALGRADRRALALIAGPLALAWAAAGLRLYPFSGRLILFTVPLFGMLVARGIAVVWGQGNRLRAAAALVIWGLLVAPPAWATLKALAEPRGREELRDVLSDIAPRLCDRDTLYVYYGAWPAFAYYRHRYVPAEVDVVFGSRFRDAPENYLREVERLAAGRVWALFSHNFKDAGLDEERYIRSALDELGARVDQVRRPGAAAYLYECRGPRPSPPGPGGEDARRTGGP